MPNRAPETWRLYRVKGHDGRPSGSWSLSLPKSDRRRVHKLLVLRRPGVVPDDVWVTHLRRTLCSMTEVTSNGRPSQLC